MKCSGNMQVYVKMLHVQQGSVEDFIVTQSVTQYINLNIKHAYTANKNK